MKTILITGINGFLGSHIASRIKDKYNIVGIERSLENLNRIKNLNCHVYLSDPDSMHELFRIESIDMIIHTATLYGKNNEDAITIVESNLVMPLILLYEAINSGVEIFINTDTALERFVSTYAMTKKQLLDWLRFNKNKIKIINMQLEHFYGPGCDSSNFISDMIIKLIRNETIYLTPGKQKRDFIYYSDVIDAFEMVLDRCECFKEPFFHFEVGTGKLISIKELLILLKELTNSNSILNFGALPYRKTELMESNADNSKLLELGWRPKIKLSEGLSRTIKHIG